MFTARRKISKIVGEVAIFSLCKLAKGMGGGDPFQRHEKCVVFYAIIVLWIWIMNCVLFGLLDITVVLEDFLTINYENYAGYLPAVPDTVLFAEFGLG